MPNTSNPVDTFLTAQQKRNLEKREETQRLWHQWDTNGRNAAHLEPLLDNFSGLIGAKVREWKPPFVPKSAFEAEVTKHVIKAIETYSPDRGASLNTHVNVRVQKAKRYMVQQQNMARIPEGQAYLIGDINKARDILQEDLGRMPTPAELAAQVRSTGTSSAAKNVTPKQVGTIIKSQRRDIPSSAWESDPEPKTIQRQQEILPLLRYTLNEKEQKVFDHVYGHAGTPVIRSTTALANRLGMSASQISRIKSSIAAKYNKYL